MTPTVLRLRDVLSYDALTGALTWKVSRGKAKAGDQVTTVDARGYIVLGLDGVRLYAHRVALALHVGEWPTGVVDHIDGNKGNNAASNLRDVSVMVNAQNRRRVAARSKSKVLGVRPFHGKWRAQISVNGKGTFLGDFQTLEEAHSCYLAAKRELHAGCTL